MILLLPLSVLLLLLLLLPLLVWPFKQNPLMYSSGKVPPPRRSRHIAKAAAAVPLPPAAVAVCGCFLLFSTAAILHDKIGYSGNFAVSRSAESCKMINGKAAATATTTAAATTAAAAATTAAATTATAATTQNHHNKNNDRQFNRLQAAPRMLTGGLPDDPLRA